MIFFKKKPKHTITILPHPVLCAAGEIVPAYAGKSIVESLLESGVEISHSCQMQCACTTCQVHIIEGEQFLSTKQEDESAELSNCQDNQGWSRLGCQAVFEGGGNLVVEICN